MKIVLNRVEKNIVKTVVVVGLLIAIGLGIVITIKKISNDIEQKQIKKLKQRAANRVIPLLIELDENTDPISWEKAKKKLLIKENA